MIKVTRQDNSSLMDIISCYFCFVSGFQSKQIKMVEERLGTGGVACPTTHFIAAPGLLIAAKESLPTLSDEPYHCKAGFAFSERSFGKSKPVLCFAQSHWFCSWPFLYYDEGQDVVFCHTNFQR